MQNREELRLKGHGRSRKTMYCESGQNIMFGKGGGNINIVLDQNADPWLSGITSNFLFENEK
jgi:hypothetical protein